MPKPQPAAKPMPKPAPQPVAKPMPQPAAKPIAKPMPQPSAKPMVAGTGKPVQMERMKPPLGAFKPSQPNPIGVRTFNIPVLDRQRWILNNLLIETFDWSVLTQEELMWLNKLYYEGRLTAREAEMYEQMAVDQMLMQPMGQQPLMQQGAYFAPPPDAMQGTGEHFCPQCGAALPGNDKFCPECGARL